MVILPLWLCVLLACAAVLPAAALLASCLLLLWFCRAADRHMSEHP